MFEVLKVVHVHDAHCGCTQDFAIDVIVHERMHASPSFFIEPASDVASSLGPANAGLLGDILRFNGLPTPSGVAQLTGLAPSQGRPSWTSASFAAPSGAATEKLEATQLEFVAIRRQMRHTWAEPTERAMVTQFVNVMMHYVWKALL
jgi:hypothetical protein